MEGPGVFTIVLLLAVSAVYAGSSIRVVPEEEKVPLALPKADVFIVPHSHQDVGWTDTPEGYYQRKVKDIYDTVVEELSKDKSRRFISVEMWFVHRWWQDATDVQKQAFQSLLKSKQIELVNAGWVMQDGAVTTYEADIDQMTLGHTFAFDLFGERPQIGWHIDPFGSSSVTPTHMAMMGFNVFVNNRIDYAEQQQMQKEKRLQFIWRGSPSLGTAEEMFTHNLGQFGYCSPWVMDWDQPLTPPVLNLTKLYFAIDFLYFSDQITSWMQSPLTLFPWGCDFEFFNATVMFENMDKLMKYLNEESWDFNVTVHYATLSEYYEAVHNLNLTWPTRGAEDFFPYDSGPTAFWTGFYTSRPHLKGFARSRQTLLALGEKMHSWSLALGLEVTGDLQPLRDALGVIQHHDCITGTEAHDFVVEDYLQRLSVGSDWTQESLVSSFGALAAKDGGSPRPSLTFDPDILLRIHPGQTVPVVVANSIGWTQQSVVSLPISNGVHLQVVDDSSKVVPSQIASCPELGMETSCVFFQAHAPPFGFATYFVEALESESGQEDVAFYSHNIRPELGQPDFTIDNDFYTLSFNGETGLLAAISSKSTGETMAMSLEFFEYTSAGSSAYIFRPSGPAQKVAGGPVKVTVVRGPVVSQVEQTFTANYVQILRLYAGQEHVEVLQVVGPLEVGREAISRIVTNLTTNGEFFTDNNGLEMHKRQFNANVTEPIAGNYYPFVSMAFLEDSAANQQLTLVADRSHGITSLTSGAVEWMLHRRLPNYLANDTDVVHVQTRLHFASRKEGTRWRHREVLLMQYPLNVVFCTELLGPEAYTTKYRTSRQFLVDALPANVHLMSYNTLPFMSNSTVLRLVHIYEVDEDPEFSKSVSVNVSQMFGNVKVQSLEERSLSTVWSREEMEKERWVWKAEERPTQLETSSRTLSQDFVVTLHPMNIGTYFIETVQ